MRKKILRVVVIALLILLIPFFGNIFVDGWNWGVFDFVWAFVLFVVSGLIYEFVSRKGSATEYKIGTAVAVLSSLLLVWVNAAVGIIGEPGGANMMYFGVIFIGLIGLALSRLQALKMANTMFAMAIAQILVPIIALTVWKSDFSPGVTEVFSLSIFFAVLFIVSGILFRNSVKQ